MYTLKELCIENICYNLHINYKIVRKKSWRIPVAIGDILFENLMKIKEIITENDLLIFNKEFTTLKNIKLNGKQLKNIKSYDFLNNHNLDNLIMDEIKFSIKNINMKINIKNILIRKVDFFNKNFKLLKNLNLNFIIHNSIIIEDMKNKIYFDLLNSIIQNSCKSLKVLSMKNCYFSIYFLKKLSKSVKKLKYIQELQFSPLTTHSYFDDEYGIFFNGILYSYKNLRILDLRYYSLHNSIYNYLDEFLTYLTCLNEFLFRFNSSEFPFQNHILNSLEYYHSKNLRKLSLYFLHFPIETIKNLIKLLKNCNKLEDIYLDSLCKTCSTDREKIIDSLLSSKNTLKIINLDLKFFDKELYAKNFCNILQNSTNLNKLKITSKNFHRQIIPGILKVIEISNNSLTEIDIFYDKSNEKEIIEFGNCLNYLKILKIFKLYKMKITKNSMDSICTSLLSLNEHLEELDFTDCHLNDNNSMKLFELLRKCYNLRYLNLSENSLNLNFFQNLLINLNSVKNIIEIIKLRNCQLTEEIGFPLAKFLEECFKIKEINLEKNFLSLDGIKEICKSLKSSKFTLERVEFQLCNVNFDFTDDVEKLFKFCYSTKNIDISKYISFNKINNLVYFA